MFCHQCGSDIPERSVFCSSCGQPQAAGAPGRPGRDATDPTAPSEPIMTLAPVFVPALQVLGHIPIFLFLGLWGGFFFGGFSMFFIDFLDVAIPKWAPFVGFGLLFSCVMPVISYRMNRKSYAKTSYTFYPDKLEYFEGFFTVEEKTIALDRVTEVQLRKGAVQKKYGLGTILLATPASSVGGRSASGIRILDIENPDEVYAQVKRLVERSNQPVRRAA